MGSDMSSTIQKSTVWYSPVPLGSLAWRMAHWVQCFVDLRLPCPSSQTVSLPAGINQYSMNIPYSISHQDAIHVPFIWRFPESWGYPQISSMSRWDFHKNHPSYWDTPMTMEISKLLQCHPKIHHVQGINPSYHIDLPSISLIQVDYPSINLWLEISSSMKIPTIHPFLEDPLFETPIFSSQNSPCPWYKRYKPIISHWIPMDLPLDLQDFNGDHKDDDVRAEEERVEWTLTTNDAAASPSRQEPRWAPDLWGLKLEMEYVLFMYNMML